MSKKHYTPRLTDEGRKIKEGIKAKGEQLQNKATSSKDAYEMRLSNLWDQEESATFKTRAWYKFKLPRIFIPAVVALGLFVLLISASSPVYYTAPSTIGQGGTALGVSSGLTESESSDYDSAGMKLSLVEPTLVESSINYRRTFKERFIDRLGRHDADPDEIAAREQLYEQDVRINLMTIKSHDDVNTFMRTSFDSLGGFIETSNVYQQGRIYIKGKVPAQSLEAFKIIVRNFAGEEKYYRDSTRSYNRTADVIVIEEEYEKVEESIAYLEDVLKQESDPKKRAELESKLNENKSYLREREATKGAIINRVEYVDVDLTITLLPTFWKAGSFRDFQRLYVGFDSPTLLDKFKINATAVILFFIHLLSYVFWLIPIIWLWWRRSYRAEPLLKELD